MNNKYNAGYKNSKSFGNVGEMRIAYEFVKRGFVVSFPFGDNARYDMIVDINGELKRVQAKTTARQNEYGAFTFHNYYQTYHRNNKHKFVYDDSEIDYVCCYVQPIDECLIIPIKDLDSNTIAFRVDGDYTKSGQEKGIRFIGDYSFDKVIGYSDTFKSEKKQQNKDTLIDRLIKECNNLS